jgi:hypothetical protein
MEKTTKVIESSDLYRKIDALGLSATDRSKARNAIGIAEKLTSVVVRVLSGVGISSAGIAPNPKLKHQ